MFDTALRTWLTPSKRPVPTGWGCMSGTSARAP